MTFHKTENQAEAEAFPLLNAVLCVDCECVSSTRGDECPVCGSRSVLNLARMLGGSLTAHKTRENKKNTSVRFDLDISIQLKGVEGGHLNAVVQGITNAIGSSLGQDRALIHLNVEPVVHSSTAKMEVA